MKVIIKSYYKDSSLFKKGIFVDPIPSNSTQVRILKQKQGQDIFQKKLKIVFGIEMEENVYNAEIMKI